MRVAAYRRNRKLLGEFVSVSDASRILGIDRRQIYDVLLGKCKMAWALEGPGKVFGTLVFKEIDPNKKGQC